ncbi:hypothetical protein [Brachybacterium sp. NPDC056505]|uniref:hypothetical protein n=1 Tax=Brachybacterium sp. NPDC056505 TaxID=3345843 RepID=UPI00367168AD
MFRSFDEEIDDREKAQKPLRTAEQIRTLALHQVAEHLPFGVVCLCGAELADLNAPLDDARIGGRQLAIAVHQAQELHALAVVGLAPEDGEER